MEIYPNTRACCTPSRSPPTARSRWSARAAWTGAAFRSNFENNLVIDDAATSATIRERQLGYVSVSQRVALDTARRWPFGRRLVQNAVGMMAPVL